MKKTFNFKLDFKINFYFHLTNLYFKLNLLLYRHFKDFKNFYYLVLQVLNKFLKHST